MSRRAGLLAVGLGCFGGFYLLAAWFVAPVALAGSGGSGGAFQIADFLYQISLTEAYWSGVIETPYATGEQARVLATYFGSSGDVAMAHGMSPVVLVLWYPLALISRAHPGAVYSLWLAVCFTAFVLGLARVYGSASSERRDLRLFFAMAVLAVAASRVGWRTFAVGQSAPLAAAGLVLLVVRLVTREPDERTGKGPDGVLVVAYLLVLWKLHYIALAGGLHFMLGRPRRAVVFATGAVVMAVGIPSVFDPTLFTSFVDQLIQFAGGAFPAEYVQIGQATEGGSGVTLRSVLREQMPEPLADGLSWALFAAAMMGLVWRRFRAKEPGTPGADAVRRSGPRLAVLFLGAVLLLLPYLGRYDDLFLVVVVSIVVTSDPARIPTWVAVATALCLALACLLPAPDLGGSANLVFAAKGAGLVLLVWLARPPLRSGGDGESRVARGERPPAGTSAAGATNRVET